MRAISSRAGRFTRSSRSTSFSVGLYGAPGNGLKPVAIRMQQLSRADAEGFYAVHKERGFFKALCDFMTSGPVVIMALEGENAVLKNRDLMGATDPTKATKGTIRADFAKSIDANTVHGSDSAENAKIEIAYFFRSTEQCAYEWKR